MRFAFAYEKERKILKLGGDSYSHAKFWLWTNFKILYEKLGVLSRIKIFLKASINTKCNFTQPNTTMVWRIVDWADQILENGSFEFHADGVTLIDKVQYTPCLSLRNSYINVNILLSWPSRKNFQHPIIVSNWIISSKKYHIDFASSLRLGRHPTELF